MGGFFIRFKNFDKVFCVESNAMGIGIPLWYMICSSDKGSHHEQVALETCLKVIFARMPRVRPNAIVIDKSWTSYNAISNVIAQDRESLTFMYMDAIQGISQERDMTCTTCRFILM